MATIENINFSNIQQRAATSISGVWTHDDNIDSNGLYEYDEGKVVMGLDIDWNGAQWSSITGAQPSTINTTGEFMKGVYSPMFAKAA